LREKGLKVAIYIYKAYNIDIEIDININIAGLNKCENGG
jgi:hypothetical protein